MGQVTCIKCNKVIRKVNSGRNYASICADCAKDLEEAMTQEQRLAHAKVGMSVLIDEVTGFQQTRPKDDLKKHLENTLRRENKMPDEITLPVYTCLRCGYQWVPTAIVKDGVVEYGYPKRCPHPKCNSPYWDRERRNRINKEVK